VVSSPWAHLQVAEDVVDGAGQAFERPCADQAGVPRSCAVTCPLGDCLKQGLVSFAETGHCSATAQYRMLCHTVSHSCYTGVTQYVGAYRAPTNAFPASSCAAVAPFFTALLVCCVELCTSCSATLYRQAQHRVPEPHPSVTCEIGSVRPGIHVHPKGLNP
jgi:hypothetical protein